MYKSYTRNMVIFVFVVDTSASMNQRTSIGTTLLDVAKNAVETFTKVRIFPLFSLKAQNERCFIYLTCKICLVQLRQRDQASRTDRYMLVTLEEPPGAIKVWPYCEHRAAMKLLITEIVSQYCTSDDSCQCREIAEKQHLSVRKCISSLRSLL